MMAAMASNVAVAAGTEYASCGYTAAGCFTAGTALSLESMAGPRNLLTTLAHVHLLVKTREKKLTLAGGNRP